MSPSQSREVAHIGKSVVIKGELTASEDLVIEGQVEGKVELRDHLLTIGPNGKVKAQVFARTVVVEGEVRGNVMATERVDIRDAGSVEGDLSAPRVAIADGAHFRGSIDMQRGGTDVKVAGASIKPAVPAPAPAPAPAIASAPSPLLK
jgi:cytoskeletal protein CcmA (bactofilin family)